MMHSHYIKRNYPEVADKVLILVVMDDALAPIVHNGYG